MNFFRPHSSITWRKFWNSINSWVLICTHCISNLHLHMISNIPIWYDPPRKFSISWWLENFSENRLMFCFLGTFSTYIWSCYKKTFRRWHQNWISHLKWATVYFLSQEFENFPKSQRKEYWNFQMNFQNFSNGNTKEKFLEEYTFFFIFHYWDTVLQNKNHFDNNTPNSGRKNII